MKVAISGFASILDPSIPISLRNVRLQGLMGGADVLDPAGGTAGDEADRRCRHDADQNLSPQHFQVWRDMCGHAEEGMEEGVWCRSRSNRE